MSHPPDSRQVWIDEATRLFHRAEALLRGGYAIKSMSGTVYDIGPLQKMQSDEGLVAVMRAAAFLANAGVELLKGEIDAAVEVAGLEVVEEARDEASSEIVSLPAASEEVLLATSETTSPKASSTHGGEGEPRISWRERQKLERGA